MINEERLIGQFLELVQVDSETKHERQIADVLKRNSANWDWTSWRTVRQR